MAISASESSEGGSLKFTVDTSPSPEHQNGPRTAALLISNRKPILTPSFFATTSRGIVPHLTPDVFSQHTSTDGVFMALEDFIELAPKRAPPILTCPIQSPTSTRLHSFSTLPPSFATIMAPRRVPAVKAAVGNSDEGVSAFTSVGFHELSNQNYGMYAHELRPDIVIGMPDVPFGTVPGTKRLAKMEGRTQYWLQELITTLKDRSDNNPTEHPAIFAPILPISYRDQSEYLSFLFEEMIEVEGQNSIRGLAFYDSSLIADIKSSEATNALPRLSLDVPSGPHELLRQISLGIDLFTIPFINFATDAGLALSFSFAPSSESTADSGGVLPLATDMFSKDGAKNLGALMKGCTCYTCREHHIAYITHLLSAKEMLGWVLLQVHNHHVLSEFFQQIRQAIGDGSFEDKVKSFGRIYDTEFPEGTGAKPRVRGYHYKTEGPGELKRNKPAWGLLAESENETPLAPDEGAAELESKGFGEVAS